MFRKIIKSLIIFLLLSFLIAIWALEPTSLNPFATPQLPLVESIAGSDCIKQIKNQADKLVNESINRNTFISVSAGTYHKDCGMYLATAGFASKKNEQRPNAKTLYRTASIGKPITAVAIMQLVESRSLDLDKPIQAYLPEFPKKDKGEITIKHLLSHTSGVRHYTSTIDGISFKHYMTLVDALDEFKHDPLLFEPGTSYLYTTYGYTILGAIIEKVTGLSFQEYLKQNIFLPARMLDTELEDAHKKYTNQASLYIRVGKRFIKSPKTDLSVKYSGGGYLTTAKDMLLFGKAILENTLVDSSTLSKMIDYSDSIKEGTPYGFGWFIYDHHKKGKILMHGGSQSGASSEFNLNLEEGIVTIALSNSFGSNAGTQQLVFGLADILFEKLNQ